MLLQPLDRIAQRPVLAFVAGPVAGGVVARRMRRNAVGEELDQCRPDIGPRPFGGPASDGMDGEKIIAVDPDAGNAKP